MDRGLYQKEVAESLGVSEDTIGNWEKSMRTPMIGKMKVIIAFLGYIPMTHLHISKLADTIIAYRQANGLTRKDMARIIGIDERTLKDLEEGKVRFFRATEEKIKKFLKSIA